MERCEPTQWFNNHKGFTFFSDEPHHKGLVHLPLSVFLRGGIRSLSTTIRGTTHNELGAPERLSTTIRGTTHKGIGSSRTASSDHTRVQPPQRRLGSKDPRVTSSSSFQLPRILVESTPMHQMQKARAQVLKSFTLKFQQSNKCLWGNKRGRTKRRCTKNSKIKIY